MRKQTLNLYIVPTYEIYVTKHKSIIIVSVAKTNTHVAVDQSIIFYRNNIPLQKMIPFILKF
jgi:hypothetical protein